MTTMVRGSLKPDLAVTISDTSLDATFAGLTTADMWVNIEQGGIVLSRSRPSSVVIAADNKSALVKRAWGATETATAGRLWVSVEVDWPGAKPQTFPASGALRIDVDRAPGDA